MTDEDGALVRSTPTLPCSDGFTMPSYLARPAGDGPWPGIVMMYEAFGMNDEMRRLADVFAAAGFVVLIPDLFARGTRIGCVTRLMGQLRRGEGRGVDDLLQARATLAELPEVDGERIGIAGFCIGGGFALLLAKTGLFRVAAPFYGEAPTSLEGSCPVVGSWGGRDRFYLASAERTEAELTRLGVPHDVKVYPGVGHSFMNRAPNRLIGWIERLAGAGFQPEAAADATERVVAFFEEHLGA
ncbi:MAG: dienelactone hydrolase family protein [Myxococcota bacterium]